MQRVSACVQCKCEIGLPDELYEAAIRSPKISFYCAYGHSQHFSEDGIRKYWAARSQAAELKFTDMTNVVQFKGKTNEAQRGP